jgi:hypothetical protein
MTVDNAGWSLLDRGGRLETLDRDECRRLLDATKVGPEDATPMTGRSAPSKT